MPSKFTVRPPYPHFSIERLAFLEVGAPLALDRLEFVRMGDQMGPLVARELLKSQADIIQPGLVHEIAVTVRRIGGHQDWNCVDRRLELALRLGEPRLALPQCGFGSLLVFDIEADPIPAHDLAVHVAERHTPDHVPTPLSVGAAQPMLEVKWL